MSDRLDDDIQDGFEHMALPQPDGAPPEPSDKAIAAGAEAANRFGVALSDLGFFDKIEAIGKAMYAVDFGARPPELAALSVGPRQTEGNPPEQLWKIANDFCGFCDEGHPLRRDEHGWWWHEVEGRPIHCDAASAHELAAALRSVADPAAPRDGGRPA
jgi:hypothetical protein